MDYFHTIDGINPKVWLDIKFAQGRVDDIFDADIIYGWNLSYDTCEEYMAENNGSLGTMKIGMYLCENRPVFGTKDSIHYFIQHFSHVDVRYEDINTEFIKEILSQMEVYLPHIVQFICEYNVFDEFEFVVGTHDSNFLRTVNLFTCSRRGICNLVISLMRGINTVIQDMNSFLSCLDLFYNCCRASELHDMICEYFLVAEQNANYWNYVDSRIPFDGTTTKSDLSFHDIPGIYRVSNDTIIHRRYRYVSCVCCCYGMYNGIVQKNFIFNDPSTVSCYTDRTITIPREGCSLGDKYNLSVVDGVKYHYVVWLHDINTYSVRYIGSMAYVSRFRNDLARIGYNNYLPWAHILASTESPHIRLFVDMYDEKVYGSGYVKRMLCYKMLELMRILMNKMSSMFNYKTYNLKTRDSWSNDHKEIYHGVFDTTVMSKFPVLYEYDPKDDYWYSVWIDDYKEYLRVAKGISYMLYLLVKNCLVVRIAYSLSNTLWLQKLVPAISKKIEDCISYNDTELFIDLMDMERSELPFITRDGEESDFNTSHPASRFYRDTPFLNFSVNISKLIQKRRIYVKWIPNKSLEYSGLNFRKKLQDRQQKTKQKTFNEVDRTHDFRLRRDCSDADYDRIRRRARETSDRRVQLSTVKLISSTLDDVVIKKIGDRTVRIIDLSSY
jgi:hypothetical protein